jgi:hypothetical protein
MATVVTRDIVADAARNRAQERQPTCRRSSRDDGFALPSAHFVARGGRRTVTANSSDTSTPAVRTPEYQAPAVIALGSVAQVTLGSVGSFLDGNGRGSKKDKGKKK